MIGKRFGRLVVAERSTNDKDGNARWTCICDCGNNTTVLAKSLRGGRTRSCGCLLSESSKTRMTELLTKHGRSGTKLYCVYRSMIERCTKPQHKSFHNYGARGISVCDEWTNDRIAFFEWAVDNGYREGLTLDRIDNDGNYEPSNCRWVTQKENSNNTRKNVRFSFGGETHTISEWANITGLSYSKIYQRYRARKNPKDILSVN